MALFRRNARHVAEGQRASLASRHGAHEVTSEFSTSICRFVLECRCGVTFDTNYIDEALEWRELHQRLAPLSDELTSPARV